MPQTAPLINVAAPFIPEDELMAHIEDTPLIWVTRAGHPVKLTWNELSDAERESLHEAEERAAYCALFAIY